MAQLIIHPTRLPSELLSYVTQSKPSAFVAKSAIHKFRLATNVSRLLADYCVPTYVLSDVAHQCIDTVEYVVIQALRLDRRDEEMFRRKKITELRWQMDQSRSLIEYESCTERLDALQGHDSWKSQKQSIEPTYNPEVIEKHLQELESAACEVDVARMAHLLRTTLSRDLGGMSQLRLYKHSWFGTKTLINDYNDIAVATIEECVRAAVQSNVSVAEASSLQVVFEDALKYFGRSALMLSGGGVFGMKHIGIVKALFAAELLPQIISGASAGSIVAAVVGVSTDEEMDDALERFPYSDLNVFDDPDTAGLRWWQARIQTARKTRLRAFFEGGNLERVIKSWVGDLTFKEAHRKTGRVLNICVSSADRSEARILNYMTAPDVYIWSAVCASCAVPAVFLPTTIYEKDSANRARKVWMANSRQVFVDGSLDHDIPRRKLSEMFNVNWTLVSQVNPHVRLCMEAEESFRGVQPTTGIHRSNPIRAAFVLFFEEVAYRTQLVEPYFSIARYGSVLSQQYTGDINILPKIGWLEGLKIMANPTARYMLQATESGERATWPKMCRIRNTVTIELALIKAVHTLRDYANFNPEARADRQAARESARGRSQGPRPNFLRRRSLSNDYTRPTLIPHTADGPVSPSPIRGVRRNASAGSLIERLERMTSAQPKELAPQAGLDGGESNQVSEESLNMTIRGPNHQAPPSSNTLTNGVGGGSFDQYPIEDDDILDMNGDGKFSAGLSNAP